VPVCAPAGGAPAGGAVGGLGCWASASDIGRMAAGTAAANTASPSKERALRREITSVSLITNSLISTPNVRGLAMNVN